MSCSSTQNTVPPVRLGQYVVLIRFLNLKSSFFLENWLITKLNDSIQRLRKGQIKSLEKINN